MTRRCVAQVMLADGSGVRGAEQVAAALGSASGGPIGVRSSHAAVHYDFAVGGGQLTWDLLLESESRFGHGASPAGVLSAESLREILPESARAVAGRIERIEIAEPEEIASGMKVPGLVGVKRTLWLRVRPDAPEDLVARFEAETPVLAEAIPAIRNWRWSRIPSSISGAGEGEGGDGLRWTHLWEQEFETVEGLQIDYMSSPVHWGFIDRYFDPEMPDCIVDPWLAHLACPETAPVLSWYLNR